MQASGKGEAEAGRAKAEGACCKLLVPTGTPAAPAPLLLLLQQLYKELQASWLTPVEIFQPHYGQAIANAVLQRWNELVGCGAGGCARQQLCMRGSSVRGCWGVLDAERGCAWSSLGGC